MNNEQLRAEFEAWANGRCELYLVGPAGRYSSATTQFAWEAYQAGRSALQSQATEAYPCRIVETDFETNTVTLEMQGKYTVSSGQKYLCDVPLYRCPVPSSQVNLDSSNHIADARKMVTPLAKRKIQSKIDEGEYRYLKGATVLVNEHGRAAIVNHGGAFYWVENADMYVEFHRAETQFEPDHIPDIGKMVPEGWRLVPVEPDQALLVSMATCLNHGFGLLTKEKQDGQLYDMRKLYDEVVGKGYYSPKTRERYLAMLAASPKHTGEQ